MHFKTLGALAVAAHIAAAFQDTSPFFLFSTSELLLPPTQITSAASLSNQITKALENCPSENYIIVSQPAVDAADFSDRRAAPYLREWMLGTDKLVRSSVEVPQVLGALDTEALSRTIQAKCGAGHLRVDASTGSFAIADDMKPRVINLDFPAVKDDSSRSSKLVEHDGFLASFIDLLPSHKYTVIYTTTATTTSVHQAAVDSEEYEMDTVFSSPVHMDLKRDLASHKRESNSNITLPNGPLFEKYQYFSPGLFMGLLISLLLLSILYIGISWLSSLTVTYGAFDKEAGQLAGSKKQQ